MELRFSDSIETCMKRDGRTMAHNTLKKMRVSTVQRMNEKERPDAVTESFGMHRSWAFQCRAQVCGCGKGAGALRSTQGISRPRKMVAAQEAQACRWINGKNPMQYGFDFGLWTRQIVQKLVVMRFDVTLSLARVVAMLACFGLNAQKPLQRAYQRDPKAKELYQRESFPGTAQVVRDQGAEFFVRTELRFRVDAVHDKTRGLYGQTSVVNRPGQRQSNSAVSAVKSQGMFWFATYKVGFTEVLFVELLKKLMHRRRSLCI